MRPALLSMLRRPVLATPSLEDGRTTTTTGTSSAFSSFGADAGNSIIVLTSNYTTGRVAVSSIADTAGNTYRKAGISLFGDGNYTIECWYASDIRAHASNVVTISWAASANAVRCFAGQFSGVGRGDAFNQQSTIRISNSGTTHTTNATPETGRMGDLVVGLYALWGGTPSAMTPAGCAEIANDGDYGRGLYKVAADAAGQTLSCTSAAASQQVMGVWTFNAMVA